MRLGQAVRTWTEEAIGLLQQDTQSRAASADVQLHGPTAEMHRDRVTCPRGRGRRGGGLERRAETTQEPLERRSRNPVKNFYLFQHFLWTLVGPMIPRSNFYIWFWQGINGVFLARAVLARHQGDDVWVRHNFGRPFDDHLE